jgi:hypothetical protein
MNLRVRNQLSNTRRCSSFDNLMRIDSRCIRLQRGNQEIYKRGLAKSNHEGSAEELAKDHERGTDRDLRRWENGLYGDDRLGYG